MLHGRSPITLTQKENYSTILIMSKHLKTYEKELSCENQERSEVVDRLSRYFSSDLI